MRPETRAAYPSDWPGIARKVKEERGNRCEKCGQVGDFVSKTARGNNYLTVHHRDYNPANCEPGNLVVLCQGCHLALQQRQLPSRVRRARLEKAGQMALIDPGLLKVPTWATGQLTVGARKAQAGETAQGETAGHPLGLRRLVH